jgi:hypothetical protein
MNDVTRTLELQFELPDFELELVAQNSDTFTCSPKLPPELRRMIWRASLPGNWTLGLHSLLYSVNTNGATAWCYSKEPRNRDPKLPIALHVNQESCRGTLDRYTITSSIWRCGKSISRSKHVLRSPLYRPYSQLCFNEFPGPLFTAEILSQVIGNIFLMSRMLCEDSEIGDTGHLMARRWSTLLHKLFTQWGFLNLFHGLRELHVAEPRDVTVRRWETNQQH